MNDKTRTHTELPVDMVHEASIFALNAGKTIATLIGFWGLACLIGGLATSGAGGLLRGFLTAATGS